MASLKRQDRQGVRTPADVERKYNLGGDSASQYAKEAALAAEEAKLAAEEAKNAVANGVSKAETLNGSLWEVNFTNTGSQTLCRFETTAFQRGHAYLCFASIDGVNHTFVLSVQRDTTIRYSNSTTSGAYLLALDYAETQSVYLKQCVYAEDIVTETMGWKQFDVSKDMRLYFTEIYNEL